MPAGAVIRFITVKDNKVSPGCTDSDALASICENGPLSPIVQIYRTLSISGDRIRVLRPIYCIYTKRIRDYRLEGGHVNNTVSTGSIDAGWR